MTTAGSACTASTPPAAISLGMPSPCLRLAMGCHLGADHGANVYEYALVAVIQGLTGGLGIDRAIECDGCS